MDISVQRQLVRLIQGRLTSFLHIIPPKPICVHLDIVRATWAKLDDMGAAGGKAKDVYWMDVMIENEWETIVA